MTNSAHGEPRANFAVGRVKRDIGENNYVGAMATDRRQGDDANTVGGLDFSWWPTGQLNIQGFAARSATHGAAGDDTSYRLALGYASNFFNLDVQHFFVGSEFNAEAGFVLRDDIRFTDYTLRLVPRPDVLGIRRITLFSNGEYQTRVDGLLQDWRLSTGFSPTWNSGEDFVLFYARGFTRLDEEFDLTDDVMVPAGDYDVWELGGFATTSPNLPVVLGANWSYQGFFDGTLWELGGELTLVPNANVQTTIGFSRSSVDIPWGKFNADIGSLRLTVAASTKLVGSALFQYNSLDSELSANIRLNYVHRPGSDLFLVFTENRGTQTRLWDFQDRGFVGKLTYLTRF